VQHIEVQQLTAVAVITNDSVSAAPELKSIYGLLYNLVLLSFAETRDAQQCSVL
jgi:hypothetical protein